MVSVSVQKGSNYFSHFQPKWRRRREGKTDYKARRAMTKVDLKDYGAKKYRFVARITNNRVICQIVYATLEGDRTVAVADSQELVKYGLTVGLTNFAAAYCTGLLCARRVLTKYDMADQFVGLEEATGEYFEAEADDEGRRPFSAILDIGLNRSTKGARVFAAMKGAVDGGILIPHNPSCLPGEEDDSEACLNRILGGHVTDYMTELKEEDETKFQQQFSRYIKAGVEADDLEALYKKVHAAIRADPSPDAAIIEARKASFKKAAKKVVPKLNAAQRRERVNQKLAILAQQLK